MKQVTGATTQRKREQKLKAFQEFRLSSFPRLAVSLNELYTHQKEASLFIVTLRTKHVKDIVAKIQLAEIKLSIS